MEFFGQVADGGTGEVFVEGVQSEGVLNYYYSETAIVLEGPLRCSRKDTSACVYFGEIDRATGQVSLKHRRSNGQFYESLNGRCVPFKALF